MPFFTSLWPWQPQKISKSGHSRVSRKSTFYTSQWPKKHFRVAESGFWGEFSQVLGGSLYWKVFSDFRFGDRKCRFRDVTIRAILRKSRESRIGGLLRPVVSCIIFMPITFTDENFALPHPGNGRQLWWKTMEEVCGGSKKWSYAGGSCNAMLEEEDLASS